MGNWTIVIHGTGAHHNWATTPDPRKPAGQGYDLITGRANDYDADLMFAEFVDELKSKGHTIAGSTFTHGGMEGPDNVIRRDYVNPHLPPKAKEPARAFRKKPIVIEAVQYLGGNSYEGFPAWLSEAVGAGTVRFYPVDNHGGEYVTIATLEGVIKADPSDWIIRGVKGEIYPCKPDIFAATYDQA